VTDEELFERFCGNTMRADIAAMSDRDILRQVREMLVEDGGESYGMSDADIAAAIRRYAEAVNA
jgi:hypothetical protein